MKLYDFDAILDFGQHKGEKLRDVLDKYPSYINWCFQKIDTFCITNEIFDRLPVIIALRKENAINFTSEQKNWLKILTDLHVSKTHELKIKKAPQKFNDSFRTSNKNWLAEASGTDDPETMNDVYWNLD